MTPSRPAAAKAIPTNDSPSPTPIDCRAIISARRLWRENKGLLVAFLSFLVPLTLAYATGMSNMGLILRQRMPIILIGALLATLSWPRAVETHDQEAEDDEAEEDEAETEDEDEPAADPTAA